MELQLVHYVQIFFVLHFSLSIQCNKYVDAQNALLWCNYVFLFKSEIKLLRLHHIVIIAHTYFMVDMTSQMRLKYKTVECNMCIDTFFSSPHIRPTWYFIDYHTLAFFAHYVMLIIHILYTMVHYAALILWYQDRNPLDQKTQTNNPQTNTPHDKYPHDIYSPDKHPPWQIPPHPPPPWQIPPGHMRIIQKKKVLWHLHKFHYDK